MVPERAGSGKGYLPETWPNLSDPLYPEANRNLA
jgi:hypothetical protein